MNNDDSRIMYALEQSAEEIPPTDIDSLIQMVSLAWQLLLDDDKKRKQETSQ